MSELSLQQIKERTIKKILDIHEDSEDGAIVLFMNDGELSANVINLTTAGILEIMFELQKQMEGK